MDVLQTVLVGITGLITATGAALAAVITAMRQADRKTRIDNRELRTENGLLWEFRADATRLLHLVFSRLEEGRIDVTDLQQRRDDLATTANRIDALGQGDEDR